MAGRTRATGERLREWAAAEGGGFDLTFSAPKSVSVLFAAGDADRRALVAAHEAAVGAGAGVRRGRGVSGAPRPRRGAARAGRGSSRRPTGIACRAVDPQLHTHVVCANVARGPDGRWTALDGRRIYEHAKTAGYLYQAHLRAEVRERLGLQWGPVSKGAAELARAARRGAGRVLAPAADRRARARARAPASRCAGRAREALAHLTRERKQYGVETHTWRGGRAPARASTGSARASSTTPGARAGATRRERPRSTSCVGDRLAGAAGLTEKANTFADANVLRECAAPARARGSRRRARRRASSSPRRRDGPRPGQRRPHHEDLVAAERRLIAAALGRAGRRRRGWSSAALVERALASAPPR